MTQTPAQNKAEVKERLSQQGEQLRAFGVERVGLFGSFARDEADMQSDVDLFVDITTERKTLKNMVALSGFLHVLLGRKVELVPPASLNAFTGKHSLNEVEDVALAA